MDDRVVLLVDDDAGLRGLLTEVLTEAGYRVVAVGTEGAAALVLAQERVAVVLADTFRTTVTGPLDDQWRQLNRLRTAAFRAPLVICTAHSPNAFVDWRERGFAGLLHPDPFDPDALLAVVRDAMASPGGQA